LSAPKINYPKITSYYLHVPEKKNKPRRAIFFKKEPGVFCLKKRVVYFSFFEKEKYTTRLTH
jgi:hypothetical protein